MAPAWWLRTLLRRSRCSGLPHLLRITPNLPPTSPRNLLLSISPIQTLVFDRAPSFSRAPSLGFCSAAGSDPDPKAAAVPINTSSTASDDKSKKNKPRKKPRVDFTKVDPALLPTVILVGRPNVGKSALFNRLIRRREALVYNTPGDHVTRDIREGVAKLGDLRFQVLDSAGLETAATSGSILNRTAEMTGNVLQRSQFAIFLIDVRDGLQPLDLEVGKWLRKHAPGICTIVAMNKSESLDERGLLTAAAGEAHSLGFGDPIAISAETGLGMAELYEILRPLFEDYILRLPNGSSQYSVQEYALYGTLNGKYEPLRSNQ